MQLVEGKKNVNKENYTVNKPSLLVQSVQDRKVNLYRSNVLDDFNIETGTFMVDENGELIQMSVELNLIEDIFTDEFQNTTEDNAFNAVELFDQLNTSTQTEHDHAYK